jgi:hypothetical protein
MEMGEGEREVWKGGEEVARGYVGMEGGGVLGRAWTRWRRKQRDNGLRADMERKGEWREG